MAKNTETKTTAKGRDGRGRPARTELTEVRKRLALKGLTSITYAKFVELTTTKVVGGKTVPTALAARLESDDPDVVAKAHVDMRVKVTLAFPGCKTNMIKNTKGVPYKLQITATPEGLAHIADMRGPKGQGTMEQFITPEALAAAEEFVSAKTEDTVTETVDPLETVEVRIEADPFDLNDIDEPSAEDLAEIEAEMADSDA